MKILNHLHVHGQDLTDRTSARGNIEEINSSSSGNRVDPMLIVPEWRDPFPKSNLNGGFIGDGYVLCTDLPNKSFLKKGARYRLLGGSSSPELMTDPSYFSKDQTYNILRAELDPSSDLYQKLHNGGNYELNVELKNDLVCKGIECDVDTLRVVKVGSVYYEFVQRPCVQLAFYDGKQIQLRDNYRQGQMCANPNLPHAREACCRQERYQEVQTARMETGVTYLYEGERMMYATAEGRCNVRGLCQFESVLVFPSDDWFRKGYHWTSKDCSINVKVNSYVFLHLFLVSNTVYNLTYSCPIVPLQRGLHCNCPRC